MTHPSQTYRSHPGSPKGLRNIPFDPAGLPFFYGWGILAFGTLGVVMSAPGQSIGVSVFTDFLIDELELTRSLLSLAYLLGTIGSALLLAYAGRVYDRFGGRLVGSAAAGVLALVLLGLTLAPATADLLGGAWMPFVVISVGFFLLRFSGQGMLALASRNMVMEWFDQRRGLANAVLGISVSFGLSYSPRVFEDLIQTLGWQGAWRVIAVVVAAFAVLALLCYRDTPEAHGLVPDGPLRVKTRIRHRETTAGRAFTLAQARKTYTFRVFALALMLAGLVMTAYTFHIVSIFGDAGMGRSRAVAVFLPGAVVAVVLELIGSYASDYIKLKYLAVVQLAGLVLLTLSVAFLRPGIMVVGAIVGQGITQGMFGILSSVTWPRFFGRLHLGAVSGFALALTVGGTAIGPYVYSVGRDFTGGYTAPALACTFVAVALLVGATRADRPE
jgi:OFA family oxalate/formate antiporter-like MFS transporter